MFSNKLSDQSEFKRQYLYLRHVPLPSFLSKTEYILNSEFLFFCFRVYIGPPAVAARFLLNRVSPSFCPSFRLSRRFLEIASLVFFCFFVFGMVLQTHMKLYVTVLDFPEKIVFAPKMVQNLTFIEKCKKLKNIEKSSCTNPIFGDSLVHEICPKMFSANKIAGFFNQPYLWSKSMK